MGRAGLLCTLETHWLILKSGQGLNTRFTEKKKISSRCAEDSTVIRLAFHMESFN